MQTYHLVVRGGTTDGDGIEIATATATGVGIKADSQMGMVVVAGVVRSHMEEASRPPARALLATVTGTEGSAEEEEGAAVTMIAATETDGMIGSTHLVPVTAEDTLIELL